MASLLCSGGVPVLLRMGVLISWGNADVLGARIDVLYFLPHCLRIESLKCSTLFINDCIGVWEGLMRNEVMLDALEQLYCSKFFVIIISAVQNVLLTESFCKTPNKPWV